MDSHRYGVSTQSSVTAPSSLVDEVDLQSGEDVRLGNAGAQLRAAGANGKVNIDRATRAK